MATNQCVILLLFVCVTITSAMAASQYSVTTPIGNIYDPFYQSLGSFAVDEYNKQGKSHLYFKEVYGGQEYFVFPVPYEGVTYYLNLKAKNCSQSEALANYNATVMVAFYSGKYYYDSLTPINK